MRCLSHIAAHNLRQRATPEPAVNLFDVLIQRFAKRQQDIHQRFVTRFSLTEMHYPVGCVTHGTDDGIRLRLLLITQSGAEGI